MPRDSAALLSDLTTERLEIACTKCDRTGSYGVHAMLDRLDGDFRLTNLLNDRTRNCRRRIAPGGLHDCGARFPQLTAPGTVEGPPK